MSTSNDNLLFNVFGLLIVVMIGTNLPAIAEEASPLRMKELIENLRANERLFSNIEVEFHETYEIGDRSPFIFEKRQYEEVVSHERQIKYVSQGDWYRLDCSGNQQIGNTGTVSDDRTSSFDGEKTRLLSQKRIGNLHADRQPEPRWFAPHILSVRDAGWTIPLSVYFSGVDAIRAHPDSGSLGTELERAADENFVVTYEGEEDFDGLVCERVLVEMRIEGIPNFSERFWLARDRNYLPVRACRFTHKISKDIPVCESLCRDFREIQPAIWMPFSVEISRFRDSDVERNQMGQIQWRTRLIVKKMSLDPNYDRQFFSNLEFPDGAMMYEIEGKQVVKSWVEGADTEKEPLKQPVRPFRAAHTIIRGWWFFGMNLGLLMLVCGIAWYRYRSQMRTAAIEG